MTLFDKVGQERLYAIVHSFYSKVYQSPVISHLFVGDREIIEKKQKMFLTQFLGGPKLYSDEYGHPRMRMRHLPFAIDNAAKDEWLKLMRASIYEHIKEEDLAETLYNCFPKVAQHMRNS